MARPSSAPAVRDIPAKSRFETEVDGRLARLDYRIDGEVMTLDHTEVPPELEGRGIGSALVQAAVEHARSRGLRLRPLCGYAAAWLRRHPDHGVPVEP